MEWTQALWQAAERANLFAEVDPNQKERIILALRKMGHVVGYMGDGINDAPETHAVFEDRVFGGAGLDVYEFEPEVPAALIGMENVTLLPHLGTAALEVREAMGRMALENCSSGSLLISILEAHIPFTRMEPRASPIRILQWKE